MDGWQETRLFLDEGNLIAQTYQDCEDIIESNKRSQSDPHKSDWGRPIAEIPNVIAVKWFNEERERGNVHFKMYGPEWKTLVRRKLRDPDWRWLCLDNPSNPFHLGWRK